MKFNEFLKLASRPRKRRNRALMLAVAKRLRSLRHEAHYDQEVWADSEGCGTVCCIAGWVALEGGCPPARLVELETDDGTGVGYVRGAAINLLGVQRNEARRLFSGDPTGDWPEPFATRWTEAQNGVSGERPSRIAADFLEAVAKGRVKLTILWR